MRLLFLAVLRPHTGNAVTAERLRYVAGLSIPGLGMLGWAGRRSRACTNGWAMGAGAARRGSLFDPSCGYPVCLL